MFESRARGKAWGRPRFKPRRKYKSFTLLQAGWKLLPGNRIKMGKHIYQYFQSRDIEGTPNRCTIKRDAVGDIYICVLTDHVEPALNRVMTGKIAGFDFGLKRFLTGSNGHDIESPLFFKRSINVIKRANRNDSRKRERSNNRQRARINLARKHRQIANQRADFHYELAHQLTDEYDEIRLEDLNLKGMKVLWGRKVSDLGFADFVKKLVYIADKKGVKIVFIDKWYPSSKTCSACGTVNESLNLHDRTWQLIVVLSMTLETLQLTSTGLHQPFVRPSSCPCLAQLPFLKAPRPSGRGVCQADGLVRVSVRTSTQSGLATCRALRASLIVVPVVKISSISRIFRL